MVLGTATAGGGGEGLAVLADGAVGAGGPKYKNTKQSHQLEHNIRRAATKWFLPPLVAAFDPASGAPV